MKYRFGCPTTNKFLETFECESDQEAWYKGGQKWRAYGMHRYAGEICALERQDDLEKPKRLSGIIVCQPIRDNMEWRWHRVAVGMYDAKWQD